jgi:hypothetical protein
MSRSSNLRLTLETLGSVGFSLRGFLRANPKSKPRGLQPMRLFDILKSFSTQLVYITRRKRNKVRKT